MSAEPKYLLIKGSIDYADEIALRLDKLSRHIMPLTPTFPILLPNPIRRPFMNSLFRAAKDSNEQTT